MTKKTESLPEGSAKSSKWRRRTGGFIMISASIMTLLLALCGWYLWEQGIFESEQEQIAKLTSAIVPDSTVVFDRNGEKIGEYYNFYHVFVPFDHIPKPMINALLAVEDRRFFDHHGVNWNSMGRAFLAVISSGHMRQGGSTITMQLVKNYLLTREKKVSRKLREIVLSYYVEKNLSKERILELYLNTMYMGHGAYGIGAAAQTYFGRTIDQLDVHEYALLAGLFQAPSAYDPHKNRKAALKRQQLVLDAMVAAKFLTPKELAAIKAKPLVYTPWTPINETVAPFFLTWIRQLVSEKIGDDGETINDRGMRIYTSLDKKLQEIANTAILHANDRLAAFQGTLHLKKNDRVETAFIALDPQTGAVLAMNGGRDFKQSQFNRAIAAKRSPGSSFKPVVYSLAIDKGMSWGDMVFVTPIDVGGYKPQNHDGDNMTEVTLIKALARSLNTPVVSMAQKFGIKNVIERAQALGVRSDMPQELGVAIGGFSATPMDVARIYSVLANEGSFVDSWAISKIVDRENKTLFDANTTPIVPVQVFSKETAALLRSGFQAVLTNGTGSAMADLASVAAGKTGTSDDSRDNWFCGYTQNLVAITWVGTDGNAAMGKSASGAALALPAWGEFMHAALAGPRPAAPWPSNPEGLVPVTIDPDYGTPSQTGITALFRKNQIPRATQASEDIKTLQKDKTVYRGMKVDD